MPWRKLTESEWWHLSTYNAERYRGIMHTPEWDAKMAELQREWDATLGRGYKLR